jgi:hypothetical protein
VAIEVDRDPLAGAAALVAGLGTATPAVRKPTTKVDARTVIAREARNFPVLVRIEGLLAEEFEIDS